MKRFLIHVSTHWCGEEDTFRAVAESESDLWDLAEQLAYDNFYSYGHDQDIAEEEGYDPDEMEEGDWDKLWSRVDENAYYSSSIEECEDDEEWNEYSGEIYGENSANGMLEDTPVEEICRLVRQMGEHCLVFIVTGREGTAEVVDATKEWLKKNEIPSDAMFFRPVGDYSPGPDCKRRIYEENIKGKYNVQFVLDDSSKCVKMWREQGLICLQPNEGKF